MAPKDLAGFTEVMILLGVSSRTAQNYISREDFPEPLGRIAAGPVWWRSDIERWGRANLPLRRGRPPKKEDK